MRTAWLAGLFLVLLGLVRPPLSAAQLTVTDVSPNGAFGTALTSFEGANGVNPTGRINALVVDPINDNILYAASPFAGVWKSIDRAQSWVPASQGIRNGLTQATNAALAIDDQNPLRLLYASTEVDGRVRFACPVTIANDCNFGGLYFTLDGADTWQHINFDSVIPTGFCRRINIQAVGFAAGIAFVATSDPSCQLLMSTDPTLQNWALIQPAFSPGGILMATASSQALPSGGGGPVVFFCRGNNVWRLTNVLSTPSWQTVSLPQPCGAITAVPTSSVPNIAAVTVTQSKTNACPTTLAYLADFGTQAATQVGPPYSTDCASGIYGIWAPARGTNPTQALGPGSSYDLYATDTKWIYHYKNGGWVAIDWTQGLHVDTWSMAFPTNYDPLGGHCRAYAANDGGIAANTTDSVFPALCASTDSTSSWVGAFNGLHVLRSEGVTGVPHPIDIGCTFQRAFEFDPIQPCPTLYVGSADDDTWTSNSGGWPLSTWQDLIDHLGDSSRVIIDPATPSVGLAVRGPNNYNRILGMKNQPPQAGDPVTGANQPNATILSQAPGPTGVAVVFTPAGDKPATYGDYFDVETFMGPTCAATGNCPNDVIERNLKLGDPKNANPSQTWSDISPLAQFPAGHVGGVYVSGGHKHPTVYVMIKNTAQIQPNSVYRRGQIWKGIVGNGGQITTWTDVSGVPPFNVVDAYNLFVNPYDPDEAYAVDLGDGTIKMTRDGGVSWVPRPDLKSIATNYGEFDFDCGSFADGNSYQEGGTGPQIFGSACPITDMVFVRDVPSFRFAILYPGGVAFSRDAGVNWMPLDVTHAQPSQQPVEPPNTAFFDPTVNPVTGETSLFVGLLGRGVERINSRFDHLAAVQISYCGYCIPGVPPVAEDATVTATVSPLNATVVLHDQVDVFRGSVLFDSSTVNSVTMQFSVNGQVVQSVTHAITAAEAAAGIIQIDGGLAP